MDTQFILDNLISFSVLAAGLLTITATVWHASMLVKLVALEHAIREAKCELDELPNALLRRMHGSLVNQSQLDKLIARDSGPFKTMLENLEMERRFILDKMPIIGAIKR